MQSSRSFTVRLVLCAPLTFLALAPFAVTPLAASAAQVSGEQTFDIPSGPLGRVLNEFSRQAGVYLAGSHELAQTTRATGCGGAIASSRGSSIYCAVPACKLFGLRAAARFGF